MTINKEQYEALQAKMVVYNEWAKQYQHKNGWTVIPADAVPPNDFNNDDRSAMEIYEWEYNPPAKYFLYINEKTGMATNWMGVKLGIVSFGSAYRDNFGSVRVPVTVHGTNTVKYHGTYYKSSGDYARVKMAKYQ